MNQLKLENIKKRYDDHVVLNGLNRTFPRGSVTCICGPSGSGKTTVLRIIAGLEKPDEGNVSGRPERIAFVFQEDRLAEDFNAVSNVALTAGKGVTRKEIEAELAAVGINEFKKPVRDFSGGMKRRVAIVRAMLSDAELFLLDEPYKGLDAHMKETVMEYVSVKTAGKTVVFVTHDPEELGRMGGDVLELD